MGCRENTSGQLGDGTTTERHIPVQVSGLTSIIAIAAGVDHSLFLKNDGTVWACGNNLSGQLGDGTIVNKTTSIQVSSLSGITAIAGGGSHSLFLKNNGTVWACGLNGNGQLGDGTIIDKSTAIQITSLSNITAIEGGFYFSLFLKNNGTTWACGNNGNGQLGDGTIIDKSTPVQVTGLCTIATGIAENTIESKVSVFPNPSNGNFSIKSETTISKVEIVNMLGEKIYSAQLNSDNATIDLSKQAKGFYIYQLKSETNVLKTGKIIVE